eukprot:10546875-Alexandrium_andersonii.AAC.1
MAASQPVGRGRPHYGAHALPSSGRIGPRWWSSLARRLLLTVGFGMHSGGRRGDTADASTSRRGLLKWAALHLALWCALLPHL